MAKNTRLQAYLQMLEEEVVSGVLRAQVGVWEGVVMTVGPPPYRRLDCDGRALCYLRCRPRKRAVRIDVSGLWLLPKDNPRVQPTSSGASIMVKTREDAEAAQALLIGCILATRHAHAERRLKRAA